MEGHLAYYMEHAISPVRYSMSGLAEHFERRDALYRSLGLPAVAFVGARVLEVAPGSGQNSLFVAARRPSEFVLVEPNPTGLKDIEATYAGFKASHTSPDVFPIRFEEFEPDAAFDIVLCENWLGRGANECKLIGKLANLVAPGGVLVITAVPLAGFFPNIMRKLFALRLMRTDASIAETTERLLSAFGPHLATIPNMTRSPEDWIQDCMINPHYLRVALPFDVLLEAVGDSMDVLSTSPRFVTDWRWFKAMSGDQRDFNGPFLESAAANGPTFLDYRRVFDPLPSASRIDDLSVLFDRAHSAALEWERCLIRGDAPGRGEAGEGLGETIHAIAAQMTELDADYEETFDELVSVWENSDASPADVAGMRKFGGLFGRETVYVSFTRRPA